VIVQQRTLEMRRFCLPVLASGAALVALAAPARAEDSTTPATAETPAAPATAKRPAALPPVPAEVWADPPEGAAKPPPVEHRFAIAVSSPLGWLTKSFAASAYVALDRHHALRGNVAFYPNTGGPLAIVARLEGGTSHSGRFRDAGAAWVWYPRRAWDGFTFEAGVLARERNTRRAAEFDDITKVASITYAGRAMIGWSWLFRDRVFLSIAAGLSVGRETGTETITPDDGSATMTTTRPLDRMQVDGEAYLRIGLAFGG
jgi:hypothetical protein